MSNVLEGDLESPDDPDRGGMPYPPENHAGREGIAASPSDVALRRDRLQRDRWTRRNLPDGFLSARGPQREALYRTLLAACRGIAWTLRLRLELQGAENLPRDRDGKPAGGWIGVALPHRTWVDPFVTTLLLPEHPRQVLLGDGRAIFRLPLRRWAMTRVGGVIPIWPGGGYVAFRGYIEAIRRTLESGRVFTLFPEVGPPVPVDEARPLSPSIGYFALRTGAPVVPLVLGGTHELFLGRRIILRVLPPATARELAGLPPDAPLPRPGSAEERRVAHAIATALHDRTAPVVAELRHTAEPRPGSRKCGRWLTHAFR